MDYNISTKSINDLIPYINNSRTHSDEQIQQIASSIKEFGFTNPILIDKDNGIIAGHGRLQGAKLLNFKEVPCIILENLTEAQKKAYIIADNKLALNAGWDMELLKVELEQLKELDYNIDLLGFDEEELDEILLNSQDDEVIEFENEDEFIEPPLEPKTKLGDIYKLGEHLLICGDSTDINVIEKILPEKADMCFTDPPDLMDFTGGIHADGSKSFNASHGAIANDKMSEKDGDNFLDDINAIIKVKVQGAFYITFYRLGIDKYYASLKRNELQCRSLIIWDKGNHTLSNSDYMSCYEPMFYGWVDEHNFYGGNNGMDIWRIDRTQKNDLHPTMKPVELVVKAVQEGSRKDELVLDLFGGSGTTLIACEKTQRKARLIELDPKYCDVICERFEKLTGKKAELINE